MHFPPKENTVIQVSPSCKHIKGRLYLFFGKKSFLFLFNTNILLIFVAIYNSSVTYKVTDNICSIIKTLIDLMFFIQANTNLDLSNI